MGALNVELKKVQAIPLVADVYCTTSTNTVVVELRKNVSQGLNYKNILFFQAEGFLADQVHVAIAKLIQKKSGS